MPRRARVALGGEPWHIIQRGNNRGTCFFDSDSRLYFLEIPEEQAIRWGCQLHAWVLMTKHFPLLLTPEHASGPAGLMKHRGQRHVQSTHRRFGGTGSSWEGRFRSALAQDGAYGLNCYRYIELNPVRAGIVDHPEDFPGSSYQDNAHGSPSSMLTPHPDSLALGESAVERFRHYRALVFAGLEAHQIAAIRASTNGNWVLGREDFRTRIEIEPGRRVAPARPGRPSRNLDGPSQPAECVRGGVSNVVCPRIKVGSVRRSSLDQLAQGSGNEAAQAGRPLCFAPLPQHAQRDNGEADD